MGRLLPFLLLISVLTRSCATKNQQQQHRKDDDDDDVLWSAGQINNQVFNFDHDLARSSQRHLQLAARSTQIKNKVLLSEAVNIDAQNDVAIAVKDWPGLNGTNLFGALSFRSLIQNASALQFALLGQSIGAQAGPQPTIAIDFQVLGLKMNDDKKTIHVEGILTLRSYFLGLRSRPSWRLKSGRAPRSWNSPSRNRLSQSARVLGQLSVESREMSGHFCLSIRHNTRDPSSVIEDCKFEIVLKYPKARSILTPAVVGTVKSSRASSDPFYFDPVEFYAKFRGKYVYSKIDGSKKPCDASNVALLPDMDAYRGANICEILRLFTTFKLMRNGDCNSSACGPFAGFSELPGWVEKLLLFDLMDCNDQSGQLNGFLSLNSLGNGKDSPVGDAVLAFEGMWSPSAGRLCLMACHRPGTSSESDCSIRVQLQIARTVSLQRRFTLLGQVTSQRGNSDPRVFTPLGFQAAFREYVLQQAESLVGLVYNYTALDQLKNCTRTATGNSITVQGSYPDLSNIFDLEFRAQFKVQKQVKRAYVRVLTVGNSFRPSVLPSNRSAVPLIPAPSTHLSSNSTAKISFSIIMDYMVEQQSAPESWHPEISAEGIYDANLGKLCLIGCRMVDIPKKAIKSQEDCKILIKIQYPPVDPALSKDHPLSGTISSLREKTDPLYFEPMAVDSGLGFIYTTQAEDVLWRRDFEVFLSMITLSIAAIIVIIQLVYTNGHPETVPYMSLVMLVILTLSPMFPLVLNFEAIFSAIPQKSPLSLNGGWIEVKEVVIRIITMVLFLLQLRLLQLAWSGRGSMFNQESSRRELSERNVLKICVPIYLLGAILSIFLQWFLSYSALEAHFLWDAVQQAWWAALKGYTGVIVDFFLLPQVIANFLWGTQVKSLSLTFYGGMTCLRSLPHLYDAYRSHRFIPQNISYYFYATPESDYFSLIWDIVIPCGGMLLALVIFLQQRYGGRCIVPSKWRGDLKYQKISLQTA